MDVLYTLRVRVPDDIEPEVHDEMLAAATETDDDDGLLRWLGDKTNDAEDHLNSLLPEGFYCKLTGGTVLASD